MFILIIQLCQPLIPIGLLKHELFIQFLFPNLFVIRLFIPNRRFFWLTLRFNPETRLFVLEFHLCIYLIEVLIVRSFLLVNELNLPIQYFLVLIEWFQFVTSQLVFHSHFYIHLFPLEKNLKAK